MEALSGDVLFIGDHPPFRNLVVESLALAGRRVFTCSRREAPALLRTRIFDVLILNWLGEPDRDVEAYGELCRLAPDTLAYLFVGFFVSQAARQAIRPIGEERILPLTLAPLVDFGKWQLPLQ